ncbi:MAG: GNAT family N-acetyltransferase [Bacteriovoracia bacterium]
MVKPCALNERKAWIEFLDKNFGYSQPQSYSVDFAPFFNVSSLSWSRLLWQDNKIIASAALRPVTAIGRIGRIRLGIVGAVATATDRRGQGLSVPVMTEIEFLARANNIDGLILWSDQLEFYSKFDFKPTGTQLIFPLEDVELPVTKEQEKAFKIVPGWSFEVRGLYDKHPLRLERDDEYWKAADQIISCTRMQALKDDEVVAYLGFDRGRDLQNIVHEWGGDPIALMVLVQKVLQTRPKLFWMTHPQLQDPIRSHAEKIWKPIHSHMALFKPLSDKIKNLHDFWFWGLDSL